MKTTFFFLAIIALFTCSSCEKEINLDLNSASPKLVVEGNILMGIDTTIEWQEIKLTRSANYTGTSKPAPVTSALVKVTDGNQTYDFIHEKDGVYRSRFVATINTTYKLLIVYEGDSYEATETLRDGPGIDSLTVVFQEGAFGDEGGDFVAINATDRANFRNFYMWRLLINGEFLMNATPGNRYRSIQKDDFFDGQKLVNYVPSDEFPVEEGDVVEMQQFNISEQMYNYYYSIFNLTAASSVTGDVPPGKILGNVKNMSNSKKNALGYFGACSISIQTIEL